MESKWDRFRQLAFGACGIFAVIILAFIIWSRLPPPQLETDEQVFKTVDALFTALTARDRNLLEECEQRLDEFYDNGQTSDAVASALDGIVKQAHEGEWEPAAKKLYRFILGQRGA